MNAIIIHWAQIIGVSLSSFVLLEKGVQYSVGRFQTHPRIKLTLVTLRERERERSGERGGRERKDTRMNISILISPGIITAKMLSGHD